MRIKAVVLPNGKGLPLPAHQTAQAAGLDLHAAITEDQKVTLLPGEAKLIPLGFALELPEGFEAQIRPRSGLALKKSVTILNSPGTIDSDYRGEVAAIVINHGSAPFEVSRGDRIAQMVIARHERVELVEGLDMSTTERGEGGFASTGVSSKKA